MSLISRIEISNYLTEGLDSNHFADWNPMLNGITLRMDGQSSLVNITNGGGKTSMAELLLYLLSRDKTLLMQLREKAAPNGRGYSHARIEFRATDGASFRSPQLLEVDVNNLSGSTHVIGVALNNDTTAPPIFYAYSGTLEDSPCYKRENGTLMSVPDATFVKRTKAMPRCKWDTFIHIREWHDYVGLFISMDVVRRNAVYQARGSDDKNASFFNFKPRNGESYDSAFFKAVVAPDLLTNLMNSFSEENESTVEDTLHLSLSQIVNSEREIAKKQASLELRKSAIQDDLQPVVDAGVATNKCQSAMQTALRAVKKDVALLHHFGAQKSLHAVPGLPRPVSVLVRSDGDDARVFQVLKGMVITRDDGIAVRDKTLSDLAGVEVRRVGEVADSKRIPLSLLTLQVIDFACNFENHSSGATKGDHYRKGYTESAIEQILEALDGTQGATLDGLSDVFRAAFQIARSQIDTNPGAMKIYALEATAKANERDLDGQKKKKDDFATSISGKEQQIKSREDNEAAWQAFSKIAADIPENLRSTPKQALEWIVDEFKTTQVDLAAMHNRHGVLTQGWNEYSSALDEAGLEGIEGLRLQHATLENRSLEIQRNLKADRKKLENLLQKTPELERARSIAQKLLTECDVNLKQLGKLKASFAVFVGFFGDVDPTTTENPVTTEKIAAQNKSKLDETLRTTKFEWDGLETLKDQSARFGEIYGADVDPFEIDPLLDHSTWTEKKHLAQQRMLPLEPLNQALDSFELKFPAYSPSVWLSQADSQRAELERDKRDTELQLQNTQNEIDALDALALVDDASFAQAWALMGDGPTRLYTALQEMPLPLATRIDALSALSGLLSAPVFTSMDELEAASSKLETNGVSIPMVMIDALQAAVQAAPSTHGEMRSIGFIVGRHSRKVRILLEPDFAKDERAKMVKQLEDLATSLGEKKDALAKVDFHSADYQLALKAAKAIQEDSRSLYQQSEKVLGQALEVLQSLAPKVESKSLEILRLRRSYLNQGGEEKQSSLMEQINHLTQQIKDVSVLLTKAERRSSEESLRAYFDARKYVESGADEAYELAKSAEKEAKSTLDAREFMCSTNGAEIDGARANLQYCLDEEEDFQNANGGYRLQRLKSVLAFAARTEDVEFMQGYKDACLKKTHRASQFTSYQSSVNFERAQAYVSNLDKSDGDLVKEISDLRISLVQAEARIEELITLTGKIRDYELPNWHVLRKAVHELAYELGYQAARTVKAHESFVALEEGASPAEAHPLYKGLDHVVNTLRAPTLEQTTSLASSLAEQTMKLQELNPQDALEAFTASKRDLDSAMADYKRRKSLFCSRAREDANKQHAAFNLMELSAIESAIPERISDLLKLFDELKQSLEKDREDAQKAIQAANNANEEALRQLSSLIQVAQENLDALKLVMKRYQNGCFKIKVQLASGALIQEILVELKDKITSATPANGDAVRTMRRSDETRIKELLRVTLIDKLFLEPSVTFIHQGIRNKESLVTNKLSTGQKVALEFMWIVRQAEYEIERGLREMSSKQAAQARVKSNRAIFVDGIFSTLSDRRIIKEAFSGLGNLGGNFQIIGFLHSPTWTNDSSVFPVYHVGKKLLSSRGASLVAFTEPGRSDGTLGFFTSIAQAPENVQ